MIMSEIRGRYGMPVLYFLAVLGAIVAGLTAPDMDDLIEVRSIRVVALDGARIGARCASLSCRSSASPSSVR